jgi:nicotinate dehydrogenase subunit B
MNIFSIESFMHELAQASETDPIDFRLRQLDDPRARDVITAAAERFGWSRFPRKQGSGRGFAFARYKNLGAYAAVAVEVSLDHESGRVRLVRAAASVDSGQAVNPDAIRNQIEGGHSPICELDALRKHHLLPDAHHEPRLEQLSDPALFGGARFG